MYGYLLGLVIVCVLSIQKYTHVTGLANKTSKYICIICTRITVPPIDTKITGLPHSNYLGVSFTFIRTFSEDITFGEAVALEFQSNF